MEDSDTSPVKVEVVNQETVVDHMIKMAAGAVVVLAVQKAASKLSDIYISRRKSKALKDATTEPQK